MGTHVGDSEWQAAADEATLSRADGDTVAAHHYRLGFC